MELMKSISGSLSDAIDAMGGDLEKYLKEAEGTEEGKEEEKDSTDERLRGGTPKKRKVSYRLFRVVWKTHSEQ